MLHQGPGSLVQYRVPGFRLPSWPAVVCVDDMAPENVLRVRPQGYVTLVRLLGDDADFRWAHTPDLSEFDPSQPFTQEELVGNTPGLGDAYEMASRFLDTGLGLEYWREETMDSATVADPKDSSYDSDETVCADPDLRRAMRLSRIENYRCDPVSRVQRAHEASSPPSVSTSASDTVIDLTDGARAPTSQGKQPVKSSPFGQSSLLDNAWVSLSRTIADPTSDAVEGELTESKEYVQVRVGPEDEVYTLRKQSVWNRSYFRDLVHGIYYFGFTEDKKLELQHSALGNIDPVDFRFVAEYLESDDFGYRHPQNAEENEEAFGQCVSAWVVAEKLGMSDLMDYIVDKLEFIDLGMYEVLVFVSQIYNSPAAGLPSHDRLKDLLVTYMAHNYWVYQGDDHLHSNFIQTVQPLPELDRDISQRRVELLEERGSADDDDEQGEEGDQHEDGMEVDRSF